MTEEAMPPSPYQYQITEAHEERIQRLEGSMERVVASTAETGVKVDHLVTTVERGFKDVAKRLDRGADQFKAHELEIKQLKQNDLARDERWAVVKGAALPLIAAASGVIATRFGESVWRWFTSLF